MKIIVTGAAGFIGFHVSERLLKRGDTVLGLDNLNEYYDPKLKYDRLGELAKFANFEFQKIDISDRSAVDKTFRTIKADRVIHLAAQAGVRYSLVNPHAFIQSNLVGFHNVIDASKQHDIEHFVYASSSSVYGSNATLPFSVNDSATHPLSLYAATKKSNELIAHSYSSLFDLPTTGLRFFTVYGPWGRPDMALFIFTKSILEGKPIQVFNQGSMSRDFTYIDDIVTAIVQANDKIAVPNDFWSPQAPAAGSSNAPYRIYNVGNSNPIGLLQLVEALQKSLGLEAKIEYKPMQPGDVAATHADIRELIDSLDTWPQTPIQCGVDHFVQWYRAHYDA